MKTEQIKNRTFTARDPWAGAHKPEVTEVRGPSVSPYAMLLADQRGVEHGFRSQVNRRPTNRRS